MEVYETICFLCSCFSSTGSLYNNYSCSNDYPLTCSIGNFDFYPCSPDKYAYCHPFSYSSFNTYFCIPIRYSQF